jgi:periplasmic protein TonB
MPPELFNGLAPGARATRRSRSWRTLPLSIAAHFIVLLLILISPLAAEVQLPTPPPIRPLTVVLAHAVPVMPQPPSPARTAQPSREYAPTTAPPAIVPERPQPPAIDSDVPVDPNGLPPGLGIGDPGAIPLRPDGPPPPPPPAAPKTPATVRISTGMQPPQKIFDVKPVYPEIARVSRVQGIVILDAVLDTDGRVVQVRVLRSQPLLDQAAIDAVRQWRYTPTRLNGEPVRVLMTITMNFKLE